MTRISSMHLFRSQNMQCLSGHRPCCFQSFRLYRSREIPTNISRSKNSSIFGNYGILTKQINSVNPCHYRSEFNAVTNASSRVESEVRKLDQIPKGYAMIYRISSKDELFYQRFNAFNYALLLFSPYFVWLLYFKEYDIDSYDVEETNVAMMEAAGNEIFVLSDTEFHSVVVMFYSICVSLMFFIKRFPLRIYHNGEKYIAVFMSDICPFLRTTHSFTSATKYKWPAIWSQSLYLFGYRRARLFSDCFRSPMDKFKMTNENSDE